MCGSLGDSRHGRGWHRHIQPYLGPRRRVLWRDFDLVLTVCDSARKRCPVSPGVKRMLPHAFQDSDQPKLDEGELYSLFTRVRGEIGAFSRKLLGEELGH